jgi:hypothetical protein
MTKEDKDMFKIYAYRDKEKMWFYLDEVIRMINSDEIDTQTFMFTTMRERNASYEDSLS